MTELIGINKNRHSANDPSQLQYNRDVVLLVDLVEAAALVSVVWMIISG